MDARRWLRVMLLLPLALLACGVGCTSRPVPLPCQPAISQVAADRFEEKIRPLVEQNGAGPVILQTTSDEVTSFLTQMLEEHAGVVPLESPRVCFTSGEAYVAGRFTTVLPFEFEGMVVLAPHLAGGRVDIEIVRAWAGLVPLPSALLRSLSDTLNETLAEWEDGIHFSAIEIGEGRVTLSGHR